MKPLLRKVFPDVNRGSVRKWNTAVLEVKAPDNLSDNPPYSFYLDIHCPRDDWMKNSTDL